MRRIFARQSGRALIVAVDDGLIFGPFGGLENVKSISEGVDQSPVNAVLAFPGTFRSCADHLHRVSWITNLTASLEGVSHTRKIIVGSVEKAVSSSADAVAVHVNCTDQAEGEMLKNLGQIVREAEQFDMPVLAIMYPRRSINGETDNYDSMRNEDRKKYTRMVAHAVRVGAELGADLIKTKYTGDADSFHTVVAATPKTPIVIAGGELTSDAAALEAASGAIQAGAAGVCYGRNVYQRSDVRPFLADLSMVVDGNSEN